MLIQIPQMVWFIPFVLYCVFVLVKTTIDNKKLAEQWKEYHDGNKKNKPVICVRPPKVQPKRIDKDKDRFVVAVEVLNTTPGTTAEKVLPFVTWFTTRGREETRNNGRWWLSDEDQKKMKDSEKLAIDLLSNGSAYLFHFARTSQDPNFFYAYYRKENGKDSYYKLYNNVYRVTVHFQSNNGATADFNYVVKHINGTLSVEEVKK
jgi:hypothetical protein